MRIRLSFVLAASSLLALPVLASTANPSSSAHRRHTHRARATASQCGHVAGHASHTALANPAVVPCHVATAVSPGSDAIAPAAPVATVAAQPLSLGTPATPVPRAQVSTHPRHSAVARARFVPPLRGSLESLERQNQRDEAEGLVRIEDDAQLDRLEADRELVRVPVGYSLRVNPDLPADRRYCRPWTARFLADLARSHYARFHRALEVNSAVRTVAYQRELLQINGNAAPADGDLASPHLTGAAVDIGKKGMSFSQLSWMRAWLLPLQTAGKIDVEEEFYQSCFHITVYRSYAPPPPPRMIARRRHSSTTLLATGVH